MALAPMQFNDGEAYELMMGRWSLDLSAPSFTTPPYIELSGRLAEERG